MIVSSSLSLAPAIPRPPRPCARNSSAGVVFTYPVAVIVNTSGSSSMRSSMSNSPGSISRLERRGSAKVSRTSPNSSTMTSRSLFSSPRISCKPVMVSVSSVCSVSRSARPRRVSRPSCMSRMWLAWTSEKATASPPPSGVIPAMSASRAAARSSLARIVAMISSMRSRALMRPSTMCRRFSAISRRYCERRVMTSIW